jgi:lauroyl/myristoyl acyltransferase
VRAAWKKIRYRLEWLALKGAAKTIPLLSRNACYRLAQVTGALAATLDRAGRRVALSNLQVAFGDEFSLDRRAGIVRESYQHFARTMLDLFWSPRLTSQNISQFVELKNMELWREELKPGHPVIFGCYHYSNFEWMSHVVGFSGVLSSIIAQEFKNPLLDGFFQGLREQSGHTAVPRKGAIIRLYKTLRKKGRVALLVDTTLPPHYPTVVIECFGLKTIVTVAHAWLQERTDAPIIPSYCEPLAGGRYRVVMLPAIRPPQGATHQEIAQACWDAFEPVVRSDPAPWLWMYKHWLYKPPEAQRAYPFYAQESLECDQIAARPNYAKLDRVPIQIARGFIPDNAPRSVRRG